MPWFSLKTEKSPSAPVSIHIVTLAAGFRLSFFFGIPSESVGIPESNTLYLPFG
jgi:hypothetical protein